MVIGWLIEIKKFHIGNQIIRLSQFRIDTAKIDNTMI